MKSKVDDSLYYVEKILRLEEIKGMFFSIKANSLQLSSGTGSACDKPPKNPLKTSRIILISAKKYKKWRQNSGTVTKPGVSLIRGHSKYKDSEKYSTLNFTKPLPKNRVPMTK